MSDIDYEALFRSPLDEAEGDGGGGWGSVVAGFAAGTMVALLGAVLLGNGADVESTTQPEPSVVTTVAPTSVAPLLDLPAGYRSFVPGLGIKAEEIILGDEVITLAFTTATDRNTDPLDPVWPIGGTWWLEAAGGGGAESSRVVLNRFSPGVFSVEFPAAPFAGETSFARTMMIERWDHPEITGAATVPFGGEPFALDEPLTIPVSQETTLIVDQLELGRFLGRVAWTLEGPQQPIARVLITATLFDADGTRIGSYGAFPGLLEPSRTGVTEILWQEPFPSSQEGAVEAVVEYSVGVVEVVASDVTVDLADTSIGR